MSIYWDGTQKYWFQNLNRTNDYISLSAQVAEHAANLMWGRGLNVISDNETDKAHIDRIMEHNSIDELLYTNEMDLSLRGNTFATVEMVNGLPTVLLSDPMLLSKMGRSFVEKEVAVIWKRITIDDRSFPVKEIWDREKRTHIYFNDDGKQISIDQVTKKIKGQQLPPEVWYHNLGYVPVVHFKNKAGAYRMYSVSDHQYTGGMEAHYNRTMEVLYKTELENNITRVFASLDKKDKKQISKEAKDKGMTVAEYLAQRSAIVETDFAGDKSGDATKAAIQLIQGNPQFQSYWLGLQELKAEFFETCGYSYSRPTQNGDARNTTDIVYSNAKDMQTTKGKLQVRQAQVSELISICRDIYNKFSVGSINGELSIDIKSNIMADSISEVDKNIKKVQANLESRAHALAKMDGITLAEAEEKLKYIQEENELYGFDENVNETLNETNGGA